MESKSLPKVEVQFVLIDFEGDSCIVPASASEGALDATCDTILVLTLLCDKGCENVCI